MTRSAEETIVKIGKRLKIDRKRLLGLYETDRENHVRLTARGRSGETKLIDGWRVQYARRSGPTSGGLEIAAGLSLDRCRSSAMFRGLQAAALAVPMGGAHGGLSCDPAWLGRAGAEEVVRLYVGMLAEELQSGNDHITSHASVPRREPGSLSPTPSVISALSAARLAARRLGIHGPKPLRCSLWGFGKAGRAIAGHIESSLGPSVFVGCADAMSASANPAGLDVERLEKNKRKTGRISRGRSTRPRDILRLPADILFLAGRGEAFSARGAASVKATIIVDMTACICDEAETVLRQRGLFFVPSIIATCGEVIASFLRIRSGKPALQAGDVRKETEARLEAIFPKVVSTADRTGLSMTEAVLALGIQALL